MCLCKFGWDPPNGLEDADMKLWGRWHGDVEGIRIKSDMHPPHLPFGWGM